MMEDGNEICKLKPKKKDENNYSIDGNNSLRRETQKKT